jgi:tripartite motif-containing protein 71
MCLLHQVIKRSLNSSDNQLTTVAGIDCPGFLFNMLYYPSGIFVDINFNLYVADSGNNRIQLFQSGQLNGTTVAGNTAPGTIALNFPTGIALDADGYLFIVDSDNNRIVGSGPNGFRCVAGCSGHSSLSNQLYNPQSMAFDSYGNIFVTDTGNGRIQKFLLATNSCSKCFNKY